MGKFEFYGSGLPGIDLEELSGKLIVLEGTDGVGRSTQVSLLRPWLEHSGHAVMDTGMARSALAGKGIKRAKEGHTLGGIALSLYYATDFADRLENEMIPALRAGFIVLTDRYIYSMIARAIVRGASPEWIKQVYSFALKPDVILYLRISLDDLTPRVLHTSGFDYWESGMDLRLGEDLYDSFVSYQTGLLREFDRMAESYDFKIIDGSGTIEETFGKLQEAITPLIRTKPMLDLAAEPAEVP
ncbi:MAG: thymidylate kinase [Acidobacteria bacterium]|nr:thymidylate kinase [Acidobacteriota bacterium]